MAKKVITVKGDPIIKEGTAGGAITPGHLVTRSSGTIIVHANAGQSAQKAFALAMDFLGDSIDDAYASGDRVRYGVYRQGDEVNALVAAGAVAISEQDALESAGDGTLQKHTAVSVTVDYTQTTSTYTQTVYDAAIVAYATTALDNSGGTASARLVVEVA